MDCDGRAFRCNGGQWWVQVAGGGKLQLRSTDARFLRLAEGWWNVLLPRIAPFLYKNGGPIIMVQVATTNSSPISSHIVRGRRGNKEADLAY